MSSVTLFSAQAPPIEIGRSAQREHEPERAVEPDEDDRAATDLRGGNLSRSSTASIASCKIARTAELRFPVS